ncbi:MAG TPA: hypothetical protein VNQ80_17900 [Parapedobacter sp.]|uniref:hypothetical protein n=1 Tax=Parapedobacter sp. TaxID=1958893 RepID=UPI002CC03474|nr:hypothetical protein [Parapedobacter sp.]HWK59222.1 hypothetical protein [Parapedobacter sp.]
MQHEALITGYFEGTLTAEQQQAFAQLLAADADFAREVEFQREVRQAIVLTERAQLKQLLRNHEQKNHNATPRLRWWIGAAAAVLLVVGGGTWLWLRTSSAPALYAEYYQAYPNTVMPTVRGEPTETTTQAAFRAYDRADYVRAEELFETLYRDTGEAYSLLYRGVSLLELGRFADAESVLAQYPANSPLYAYACWYRALALLRLDDRAQARGLLEELAQGTTPLGQTARELLSRL